MKQLIKTLFTTIFVFSLNTASANSLETSINGVVNYQVLGSNSDFISGDRKGVFGSMRGYRGGLVGGDIGTKRLGFTIFEFQRPVVGGGCGKIDFQMGAFSMFTGFDSDAFVAALKKLPAQSIVYAFKLALKSMSNQIFSTLESLVNQMNSFTRDMGTGCSASKKIGKAMFDSMSSGSGAPMTKLWNDVGSQADDEKNVDDKKSDPWAKLQSIFSDETAKTEKTQEEAKGMSDKELGIAGNLVWAVLSKSNAEQLFSYDQTGFEGELEKDNWNEVIMSITGTFIETSNAKAQAKADESSADIKKDTDGKTKKTTDAEKTAAKAAAKTEEDKGKQNPEKSFKGDSHPSIMTFKHLYLGGTNNVPKYECISKGADECKTITQKSVSIKGFRKNFHEKFLGKGEDPGLIAKMKNPQAWCQNNKTSDCFNTRELDKMMKSSALMGDVLYYISRISSEASAREFFSSSSEYFAATYTYQYMSHMIRQVRTILLKERNIKRKKGADRYKKNSLLLLDELDRVQQKLKSDYSLEVSKLNNNSKGIKEIFLNQMKIDSKKFTQQLNIR